MNLGGFNLDHWIIEEKKRYRGRRVVYNGTVWIVKNVEWVEEDENFLLYVENDELKSLRLSIDDVSFVDDKI